MFYHLPKVILIIIQFKAQEMEIYFHKSIINFMLTLLHRKDDGSAS